MGFPIKSLIKKVIYSPIIAKRLIKISLKLHNFSYFFSSFLAIAVSENGNHPKHRLIKYKEWFLDNIEEQDVVIDIGCNTGNMPRVFSDKAAFVYGVDIVEKHIIKAKKDTQKENVEFICADATTYSFNEIKSVNVITLSNVLEHIDNRVPFLKKIVSNMNWAPGKKRILIRVPVEDRDWITLYKKEMGVEYRLDMTHFLEYTEDVFYRETSEAGIKVEKLNVRYGEIYAICSVES